jgi:Arc/MetJ-type ribon-helix-helix transcriptional regulator
MLTINVPEDVENSINAAVRSGRFPSIDEAVAAAWQAFDNLPAPEAETRPEVGATTPRKAIWEVAAELRESIPAEEWAKLPVDGAEQHDHYIYGLPKRPRS